MIWIYILLFVIIALIVYLIYLVRFWGRTNIELTGDTYGLQLAAVRRNRCMLFAYYSGRQYGCNAVPILNIGTLNSFIHSRRVQMPEFSPTISIFSLQKTASIS